MLWPLIEMIVAFFTAVFVFAAAAEWRVTRSHSRRWRARRGRPGLGRAWWAQKEREQRERASRFR